MVCHMLLVVASFGVLSPTPAGAALARADRSTVQAEQEIGDLSGYYTCKGQEVGGKSYSGIAVLIKKSDVYLIQWMVGGGSTFSGLAIRQGNTLAASWAIPGDRGVIRGVNLYRIETGPRLTGRWSTLPGPGVMQSETLTFLKKLDTEDE